MFPVEKDRTVYCARALDPDQPDDATVHLNARGELATVGKTLQIAQTTAPAPDVSTSIDQSPQPLDAAIPGARGVLRYKCTVLSGGSQTNLPLISGTRLRSEVSPDQLEPNTPHWSTSRYSQQSAPMAESLRSVLLAM